MSRMSSMLNAENMQTVIIVTFVLTILSMMYNAFNYNQTQIVAGVSLANQYAAFNQKSASADLIKRIEALEADAKKQAAAPTPVAPAEAEAEAAPE